MSSTMSLSLCSHQAEFCCHAATQLHSIILRSIKRCGYPGRRDFCLSFHSQCFFFFLPVTVFFFSQHFVSLTPIPPISPYSDPFSLRLFPSLHLFSLSLLLPSPLSSRGPSGDDEGAQYQGKSLQGVCSLLSFIFLCPSFGFAEHSTVTNIGF